MNKPNLFIIGAPKCGTTSLFEALSNHPLVFAPQNKEPHFYSTDFYQPGRISEKKYAELYEEAECERFLWRMDGSTRYLYSDVAIKAIKYDSPDAKFVAIFRNPADMLYSLYNHLVFTGYEREKDFRSAWKISLDHNRPLLIASGCQDPDSLNYPAMGVFGTRIQAVKSEINSTNLLVLFYDDLVTNPGKVLETLLEFLSLESFENIKIEKKNKSMARKSQMLFSVTRGLGSFKKRAGITKSFGYLNRLNFWNRKNRYRPPLPIDVRSEITAHFKKEIELLEAECGRELGDWKTVHNIPK